MDENSQSHSDDGEIGPTYRTLFLGACIVIGSAFGWWFTNFISTVEHLHQNYERRIGELEARALRETWEREAIRHDVAEVKRRLDK